MVAIKASGTNPNRIPSCFYSDFESVALDGSFRITFRGHCRGPDQTVTHLEGGRISEDWGMAEPE